MPPITVVCPSVTSTVVLARCVLIGGMPLTARLKSACAFSSAIFMMTVPAEVICGVTFSVSAASLNVTVTVLLATVWIGICTPCVISASPLFCVDTRGVDRTRRLPELSAAESARSRLNAPLIEPSARPTALVGAGRAEVHAGRLRGRTLNPAGPAAEAAVVREREVRRVAERRIDAAVEAPLHAERARVILVRLHDARFDLDLRLRLVEGRDQVGRGREAVGQIGDDERVGPRVDLHRAARREHALGQERLHVLGPRVTELLGQRVGLARVGLGFGEIGELLLLGLQHVQRRDAHDRAVGDVSERVRPENDVEGLIPRHVAQRDVHGPVHPRIDDDVQPALLGEDAQHGAKIRRPGNRG